MALRDVLVAFGVEVSGKEQLKDVDDKIIGIIDRAKQLASVLAGLTIAKQVGEFVTGVVEMGAKVVDTANRIGVATDDLQGFQYAANMVGVSSDQAAQALAQLERRAGTAADGGKAMAKAFAQAGINIHDSATGGIKPAIDLVQEAAAHLSKFTSEGQRLDYIQKLFGRSAQGLNALFRDPAKLKQYVQEFKDLGLALRGDFLRAAKEAEQGMTRLSYGLNAMKSRIVLGILPALETGMGVLMRFFGFMGRMGDETYVAQTALIALAATLAIAFAPLLLEILPIVALFTGLYLLFDEIFTLFQGGDTYIGDFIDSLFGVGSAAKFVTAVKEEAALLWEKVKELARAAVDLGPKLVGAFESAKPVLEALMRTLGGFLRLLGGAAESAVDAAHGNWAAVGKDIDRAGDAVFGKEGLLGKYFKQGGTGNDTFSQSNNTADYIPGGLGGLGPHVQVAELPQPFVGPSGTAFGPPPPTVINQKNETNITVQGGATNDETGATVADAAKGAHDASNREALAGVKATVGGRRAAK